ncbi:MAG TPA: hypothetical protein VM364_08110 [Vicinamibacterales bacterium]|nr:hypothetical protein [Vicinamibacterales bacterium]
MDVHVTGRVCGGQEIGRHVWIDGEIIAAGGGIRWVSPADPDDLRVVFARREDATLVVADGRTGEVLVETGQRANAIGAGGGIVVGWLPPLFGVGVDLSALASMRVPDHQRSTWVSPDGAVAYVPDAGYPVRVRERDGRDWLLSEEPVFDLQLLAGGRAVWKTTTGTLGTRGVVGIAPPGHWGRPRLATVGVRDYLCVFVPQHGLVVYPAADLRQGIVVPGVDPWNAYAHLVRAVDPRTVEVIWSSGPGERPHELRREHVDVLAGPFINLAGGEPGTPPPERKPEQEIPMRKPEVTVDRWTLDELKDGREFVFRDRENPHLGYSVRVFVQNGSMHAEITNAAGTGATGARRAVKQSPPAPAPLPPPPAPQGPEAVCRAIWREELEREIDPDGLADCVAQLRGGRSAEEVRAGVRQSPEYAEVQKRKREQPAPAPTPRDEIAGRIRAEGRLFRNDAGAFRPRFVSALTALAKRGQVSAYLEWAARSGFNGIRVFAGHLSWAGQTAAGALDRLPGLLTMARAHGLYVEVTALTDTREGGYDLRAHVRRCAEIVKSHDHAILEIANEPYHPTQVGELHDHATLLRLHQEIVAPLGVTCALGAPDTDEPEPGHPVADYVTLHLDRGRDPWNMVRRVRELEMASGGLNRPVLNNEPIGADETPSRGRRESDPAIFFTMGVLERIFETGGVHHSQAGLHCDLPGPVQRACAEAYVRGATLIPTAARLAFHNARRPEAAEGFIVAANLPGDGVQHTIIRAFTGVAGDRGWTVLVGLTGDPQVEWRQGWRRVRTVAEMPGVQVIEIAR